MINIYADNSNKVFIQQKKCRTKYINKIARMIKINQLININNIGKDV